MPLVTNAQAICPECGKIEPAKHSDEWARLYGGSPYHLPDHWIEIRLNNYGSDNKQTTVCGWLCAAGYALKQHYAADAERVARVAGTNPRTQTAYQEYVETFIASLLNTVRRVMGDYF